MAIAMQQRMRDLQAEWRERGQEHVFQLRIGINTGFCTVGNFGSDDRVDYTIIGNEVNLAARLQSHADLGGILLAHETYALVKDAVLTEETGTITVKGFPRPVKTYRVVGAARRRGATGARDPPGAGRPAADRRPAASSRTRGAPTRSRRCRTPIGTAVGGMTRGTPANARREHARRRHGPTRRIGLPRVIRAADRAAPASARLQRRRGDFRQRALERLHGAVDVRELVEAEEADAERLEVGGLVALQRHAGGGLQPLLDELPARLDVLVVGVAHDDAGRLEAFGRDARDSRGARAARAPSAPSSCCAARAFSKPKRSVSFIMSRMRVSASVGIVAW